MINTRSAWLLKLKKLIKMKYQIIGTDGFVYGQFPNKLCASLAFKGMSTMLDEIRIVEVN